MCFPMVQIDFLEPRRLADSALLGAWSGGVHVLGHVGGELYFQNHRDLYRGDGSPEGAIRLRPPKGVALDTNGTRRVFATQRGIFVAHASTLFAVDRVSNTLEPLASISQLGQVQVYREDLYFLGATAAAPENTELWKSDGTRAGTGRLKDLQPGPRGVRALQFAVQNDRLLIATSGGEIPLHESDGTAAGTRVLELPGHESITADAEIVASTADEVFIFTDAGGLRAIDSAQRVRPIGGDFTKPRWLGVINGQLCFYDRGGSFVGPTVIFTVVPGDDRARVIWRSDSDIYIHPLATRILLAPKVTGAASGGPTTSLDPLTGDSEAFSEAGLWGVSVKNFGSEALLRGHGGARVTNGTWKGTIFADYSSITTDGSARYAATANGAIRMDSKKAMPLGVVTGRVVRDKNANGKVDSLNDKGIANVRVFLDLNGNGRRDRGERMTHTVQNGNFTMYQVPMGTHQLKMSLPGEGWRYTAGATRLVSVGGEQIYSLRTFCAREVSAPASRTASVFSVQRIESVVSIAIVDSASSDEAYDLSST